MADYQERVGAWLEPIPGDQPAGPDARYEPDHEFIRNQVASLDTPTGGDVDWNEIVKKGSNLLVSVSKDFLVACYVGYGLYQIEGLKGLAAGLWLVAELTDRFWEEGWPKKKRIRARVNAINWLTDRVNLSLPNTQVGPGDRGPINELKEASGRLKAVIWDRFEDPSPSIQPLLDNVQRLELSLPEEEAPAPEPAPAPPPAPAPQQPAPAPQQPAPAAQAAPQPTPEAPAEPSAEDLESTLAELAAPYLEPVSGDSPAGQDSRYEPEYEEARAEVGKRDSPSGGEVDWATVERLCTTLLKTKTKDYLIGAYLAAALYEQRGFAGLATGLAVLNGLIDEYWETAFPKKKRVRARANAVELLIGLTGSLPDRSVTAADREAVALLEAASNRLRAVVYDKFEDNAPALSDLLNNVKRLTLSLPEPEPPKPEPAPAAQAQPAPAPAAPAQPAPAAQAQPAPAPAKLDIKAPKGPGEMAGVDQLVPFLRDQVGDALYKASRELFKANKSSPTTYRLARLGLYLHMEEAPPTTSGQQTAVPPPPPDLLTQLDTLAKGGKWAALLEEAESSLSRYRLWLDLHRYVALALGGLGHESARQAVVDGTEGLLRRMPEVRERQFNNGQPFANAGTQEWFDTEVTPAVQEGGGGGGDGLSESERERMNAARKLSTGGKVDEAVALLQEVSREAESASVKFRARLAMAQACAAGGSQVTADGLFSVLLDDIDRFQLEQWDPDLAAKCYAAHYEMLKGLAQKTGPGEKSDPALAERVATVYSRLCRVSPSTALKLGG